MFHRLMSLVEFPNVLAVFPDFIRGKSDDDLYKHIIKIKR